MKVIVIGNGGREHAICWKLAQSNSVSQVLCVPGNCGTAGESKCRNIVPEKCNYVDSDKNVLIQIAQHENCDMAIIGPENPLADGLADEFRKAGIPCVGPGKEAAQLEASKDFAKAFMHKYGVACARSETFADENNAKEYVRQHGAPVVIKADGLAAGKGVTVAATVEEALTAITDIMDSGRVGNAGRKLVIEDYLEGVEMSVLAAVSVYPEQNGDQNKKPAILPFLPARDHKRLNDGAKGPNTGGMGAVAPLSDVTPEIMAQFDTAILRPTLQGLIAEKYDYRGFLFFGVMLTKDGPKLLEYNVRLGDPETQAVLPLMESDFASLCTAITDGTLSSFNLKWKDGFVVAPVAVSGGYPGVYKKGYIIHIIQGAIEATGAKVFIAGAMQDRRTTEHDEIEIGHFITNGGRVLACSAFGSTFDLAREKAYCALKAIKFTGMFYRKDIGLPGAAESGKLQ